MGTAEEDGNVKLFTSVIEPDWLLAINVDWNLIQFNPLQFRRTVIAIIDTSMLPWKIIIPIPGNYGNLRKFPQLGEINYDNICRVGNRLPVT